MRSALLIAIAVVCPATVAADVALEFASPGGRPGEQVELVAMLSTDEPVAGVEIELTFDAATAIAVRDDGRPDCEEEPSIDKGATGFSFRPARCDPFHRRCKAVRALVIATDNTDAIPSSAVVFRCRVDIAFDAEPGMYRFRPRRGLYSPPEGKDRELTAEEFVLRVSGVPLATPTPRPSPTPTSTSSRNGSGGGGCQLGSKDSTHRSVPITLVMFVLAMFMLLNSRKALLKSRSHPERRCRCRRRIGTGSSRNTAREAGNDSSST